MHRDVGGAGAWSGRAARGSRSASVVYLPCGTKPGQWRPGLQAERRVSAA
jgi:hypothetical protein